MYYIYIYIYSFKLFIGPARGDHCDYVYTVGVGARCDTVGQNVIHFRSVHICTDTLVHVNRTRAPTLVHSGVCCIVKGVCHILLAAL